MEKRGGFRRRFVLPIFVLICGLAASALAAYLTHQNLAFKSRQQVRDALVELERNIQGRMGAYVGLLNGGAALFAAKPYVSREEFHRFFDRLEVARFFPGVQGFGYSVRVPQDKMEALVQNVRGQGMTNFNIWPTHPRTEYHSIVYLEPMDLRNQRAIGYDMFTDEVRRRAMETARDTAGPAFTRKVRLVQEIPGETEQHGFLLYIPVYTGGKIPATVEERRANLQGFIYCPFRAGDLFASIVPRINPRLAFAIWDGTEPNRENLLYQSNANVSGGDNDDVAVLRVPGAVWTLGVERLTGADNEPGGQMLWLVPLLGAFASVLLAYFTYTEARAREISEETANELFNQREWLEVTLGSIGDGVISTDEFGRVQFMNRMAEDLTGWNLPEATGKPLSDFFKIRDEATGAVMDNPADMVLAKGDTIHFRNPFFLRNRAGEEKCIDDSAAPIRNQRGKIIGTVLVFREISERRRYERRIKVQNAVTKVLSEAVSLPEAGERILQILCEQLGFALGITWLFNEEKGFAEAMQLWHRPELDLRDFAARSRDLRPLRGEALPGIVWQTLEPHWISEFGEDPRFQRSTDAREAGLKTALAFPVMVESQVYGAMEFFSCEALAFDAELLNVVRAIGTQLGQYVQRKQAEEALAASEELHRAITETAADGIVVIDQGSTIVAVNTAVERIFGYSKDELIGNSLKKLMPARMQEAHDRGMQRYLETGERRISWTGVELPGLRKDGTEVPLEISFGVARKGSSYLLTGLLRDITRRKEAERQLRETEERLGLLVRRAEEYAIITMGADGRISTWNPGAERIFGYNDEEVLGHGMQLLFPKTEPGVAERQIKRAETEGQIVEERWQVRKDGSQFWSAGSLVCLRSENGTVRGFAMILRDITERKKAEEAIQELNQELEVRVQRRTAALQESKEQMEAFSYTVAHDLRAPLRAMQGFAHALVEDYHPQLDSEAVGYLQRIMASAQRMDELIQDLLAYSQLSRSDLSYGPVRVPDLVQGVLAVLEGEIAAKKAEVQVSVDRLFVRAHHGTLENAVGNLVSNALKFTKPDETPKIHIRAINQGETVQISVQDNGIGIAPEHHGRIFKVFERLHGQESFPGTGIGLALVKKGMERMGGTVGVASEPGEGSLFWIELPRVEPQA